MKRCLVGVLLVLVLFILAGCSQDPQRDGISLTYNANGGTGTVPQSQTIVSGRSVVVSEPTGLEKNGLCFVGWNTRADGNGTEYAVGSTYSDTNGGTLYAQWDDIFEYTYSEEYAGYSLRRKTGKTPPPFLVIPTAYENKPVYGIEAEAFQDCTSLTHVVIPLTSDPHGTILRDQAFEGCTSLTSFKAPAVYRVEVSVFHNCTSLSTCSFGVKLDYIGNHSFENCMALTVLDFGGTYAQWSNIVTGGSWREDSGLIVVQCSDVRVPF